jgi:hypothetical protein
MLFHVCRSLRDWSVTRLFIRSCPRVLNWHDPTRKPISLRFQRPCSRFAGSGPGVISACAGCLFYFDSFAETQCRFRVATAKTASHPRQTVTDTFSKPTARGVSPVPIVFPPRSSPRFSQNNPAAREPPDRRRDRPEFPATRQWRQRGWCSRVPYARERRGATTVSRRGLARLRSY